MLDKMYDNITKIRGTQKIVLTMIVITRSDVKTLDDIKLMEVLLQRSV